MEIYRINKSFSSNKYTDAELIVAAKEIVTQMTGNVHYPVTVPTLVDIQADIDAFLAALAKVKNGTREDTVVKNDCRKKLETDLKLLAEYVEANGNNDLAILSSTGFPLRKKNESLGILPAPVSITIEPGELKGSLLLTWSAVKGNYLYQVEYTEAPVTETSIWKRVTSSKCSVLITGLKRGGLYVFRVAAAGSSSELVWSIEIESYVM